MDFQEKSETIREDRPMKNFLDEHDIRRRQHEPSPVQGREDDDFTRFVLSHKDDVKRVVCNSQEFKDAPVCSRGVIKSEDRPVEDLSFSLKVPYSHC